MMPLRRLVSAIDNGDWGTEPETDDAGIRCIRAADFDFVRLKANVRSAPLRLIREDVKRRSLLRRGDLVLEKSGGGAKTPVGRAVLFDSDQEAVCSNFAARLRPAHGVDSRYLIFLLAALYYSGATERCAIQTTGIQNLDTGAWLQTEVPEIAGLEQRRIADFLDDQVARIDNIIAAREQQIAALERFRAELLPGLLGNVSKAWSGRDAASIRAELPPSWRVSEMGHLLAQLTNGFVGPTRDILVDDGVRYIQSLHVKNGIIDFERRPYFVRPEWHHERPRINLRANDVLIVQTGDIGQVALVPEGFGEASCHALLIARVNEAVVIPEYFAEYLRSSLGRQELLARATGALHPHLEYGIKEAPIVLPPLADQVRLIRELQHQDESRAQAFETAVELTSKLAELKRSLITAAVSGELDVSSADGSQIPVGATTDVPAGTPAQPTEVPV